MLRSSGAHHAGTEEQSYVGGRTRKQPAANNSVDFDAQLRFVVDQTRALSPLLFLSRGVCEFRMREGLG